MLYTLKASALYIWCSLCTEVFSLKVFYIPLTRVWFLFHTFSFHFITSNLNEKLTNSLKQNKHTKSSDERAGSNKKSCWWNLGKSVWFLDFFLGQAVTVGVTMYVLSISELSEVQMVKMATKTVNSLLCMFNVTRLLSN